MLQFFENLLGRQRWSLITVAIASLALIGLSNLLFLSLAHPGVAGTTIVASIRPHRLIVVNHQNEIQKIVSNTEEDIRPTVVRDSLHGPETEYTNEIAEEFDQLTKSLDFKQAGVVFERSSSPIEKFIRSAVTLITNVVKVVFGWLQIIGDFLGFT